MLTLQASGSIGDFNIDDISDLEGKIATSAGVDASLVSINITAASVIIAATITVPASTSATAVLNLLSSNLGTVALASAALPIVVEKKPVMTIYAASQGAHPQPPPNCLERYGISYPSFIELAYGCYKYASRVRERRRSTDYT